MLEEVITRVHSIADRQNMEEGVNVHRIDGSEYEEIIDNDQHKENPTAELAAPDEIPNVEYVSAGGINEDVPIADQVPHDNEPIIHDVNADDDGESMVTTPVGYDAKIITNDAEEINNVKEAIIDDHINTPTNNVPINLEVTADNILPGNER